MADASSALARRAVGSALVLVLLAPGVEPARGAVEASSAGAPVEVESAASVTVGSKKFTENVILGELAAHLARDEGLPAKHLRELGGTRILWNALVAGEVDVYPEYTGTIREEILHGVEIPPGATLEDVLAGYGVAMSPPLGFNNTYAIGMKRGLADSLGLSTISGLRRHPGLVIGFTNEFLDRADGWPGLQSRYGLPHEDVRGLDHDLAYRGLAAGSIDVIDMYSTDAEILYYDLVELEDDLSYFPVYEAVYLYREELARSAPGFVGRLHGLEDAVPAETMVEMNARAKLDRVAETRVAADFLAEHQGLEVETGTEGFWARLARTTADHLTLVAISLSAAILIAVPLGIAAVRHERLGRAILGVSAVIQTIPSLALLVLMIPLMGIGGPPAILALFLYSLLPIVRNTHSGLSGIPASISDSALALGLPGGVRLRRIELPMASRSILAGIKTAAVINVGTATLGALIGAGGYGQPILTGIRLDNTQLILEGAVPAALLALLVTGLFDLLELVLVPRGLRLKSGEE
ncbi:MAG: ABC transporter permease subunit [Candidatus Eisenbacteria bacterium]|nr:ABC transporter permease subunit [Candidatus Eisenbacteria bacterium]